jgi:hypothetical protein
VSEIFRFTLLPEGTSDRALIPILRWVLGEHVGSTRTVIGSFVDSSRLPTRKKATPRDRLRSSIEIYPCEILFIHRDADSVGATKRQAEVQAWIAAAELESDVSPVAVIPVRTSEAWLLVNDAAIREAASNPNGNIALNLPPLPRLVTLPDPKETLFEALRVASELTGRRLKKFDVRVARSRVGECIQDFTILRQLDAFRRLEEQIIEVCRNRGWS